MEQFGDEGPLIVLLHWLGGSARTWTEVCEGLAARGFRCAALDLPGFGHSVDIPGYSKRAMTHAVIETIRTLRQYEPDAAWLLAGHSMGGAVATLLARAAEDGTDGLQNLAGVLLTSPSTPGPEPMPEATRKQMLAALGQSTGDAPEDRKRAENFVDNNTGKLPLKDSVRKRTVDDVLRMNRAAFVAWLEYGSKEDYAAAIGILKTPALVLAGSEEPALGPEVQQENTAPHFATATVVSIERAGHLSPIERPAKLVDLFVEFAQLLGLSLQLPASPLNPAFEAVIGGPLTSPKTGEVLQSRLDANNSAHKPIALDEPLFRTLRALAECVIPNAGFDLASCLDRKLAEDKGDGWRFDALPADTEAWRVGLASLEAASHRAHGVSFIDLHPDQQRELLEHARQGKLGRGILGAVHLGADSNTFPADQMQRWFEDVRGELVRLYVADPRTLHRIGFTGFADEDGFTHIRLNDFEEHA